MRLTIHSLASLTQRLTIEKTVQHRVFKQSKQPKGLWIALRMGLTAFQTLPGGPFSPAGYEDPQAAGLNPHPIAPPVVQSSLSFDGSACEPAWGWSCHSQAGPAGWSMSFDQAWPLSILPLQGL